ncbi:MAG: hypothetical protein K5867_02830 [Bacteroidales bacterium]|nr:hypothetical protein [Bacteroidales bacterium]
MANRFAKIGKFCHQGTPGGPAATETPANPSFRVITDAHRAVKDWRFKLALILSICDRVEPSSVVTATTVLSDADPLFSLRQKA